jgi:hypothetical protein
MDAMRWLAVVALAGTVGLVSACSSPQSLMSAGGGALFSGYPGPQWEDAHGASLSGDVVAVYHGDPHCQHDRYDFLHLGWPLGTAEDRAGREARQYVRDPDGALAEEVPYYGGELQAQWQTLEDLPEDAVAAGFSTSGAGSPSVELWLPGERNDAVYLVVDGTPELWPLVEPPVTCD